MLFRITLFIILICLCSGVGNCQENRAGTAGALFPIRSSVDGKVGYIDRFGRLKIPFQINPPTYSNLDPDFDDFSEGFAGVFLGDEKFTYINTNGQTITELRFDGVARFSEGLALVMLNKKMGFLDRSGKLTIPLVFDEAQSFFDGLAPACVSKKCGYIDKTGNFVIEPRFDSAESFSQGLAAVLIDGKYGYIDQKGTVVIQPRFGSAEYFSEGLALVGAPDANEEDSKEDRDKDKASWPEGYINMTGRLVINTKRRRYHGYENFYEGLAIIESNNEGNPRYGFINGKGQIVIPPIYDYALPFSEGLAAVGYDGPDGWYPRVGYINRTGKLVINFRYAWGGIFENGRAYVQLYSRPDDRSQYDSSRHRLTDAYINKQGKVIFRGEWIYAAEGQGDGDEEEIPKLLEVTIDSLPRGAKIFLIPLVDLDDDPQLLNGSKLIRYRMGTDTLYQNKIYEQVYKLIVELRGYREIREFDVHDGKENKVVVNFEEQTNSRKAKP